MPLPHDAPTPIPAMTAAEIVAELASLGLGLELRNGVPFLTGDKTQASDIMIDILKAYREEIIRHLSGGVP